MPQALQPYLDLAKDAGLALTDAGYAYSLLIGAAPLLTLAGLLMVFGLIATHGKSHGTRFSAMAVFGFAALAALGAWLVRPQTPADAMFASLLQWAWVPPAAAALFIFFTMPTNPKPRALGLAAATIVALAATVFGGMLSVAQARDADPEAMAWLDAAPLPEKPVADEDEQQAQAQAQQQVLVLDTAHPEKRK